MACANSCTVWMVPRRIIRWVMSAKEALDQFEPGAIGRREVEVEALPVLALLPPLDFLAFVRRRVVQGDVEFLIARDQLIQEIHKLPAAMAWLVRGDHLAVENIEGGKQRGCALPLMVVRLALW